MIWLQGLTVSGAPATFAAHRASYLLVAAISVAAGSPSGLVAWVLPALAGQALLRAVGGAGRLRHHGSVPGDGPEGGEGGRAIVEGVKERALVDLLERAPDVLLAYLFGSRRPGRSAPGQRPRSRRAVHSNPSRVVEMAVGLEQATGRSVDFVVLNRAAPLLTHEIVSTGRLLVGRDDSERAAFEARALMRYLDTGHLRRIQHQYLRERTDARRAAAR